MYHHNVVRLGRDYERKQDQRNTISKGKGQHMKNSAHDDQAGMVEEILLFVVTVAVVIFAIFYWQ